MKKCWSLSSWFSSVLTWDIVTRWVDCGHGCSYSVCVLLLLSISPTLLFSWSFTHYCFSPHQHAVVFLSHLYIRWTVQYIKINHIIHEAQHPSCLPEKVMCQENLKIGWIPFLSGAKPWFLSIQTPFPTVLELKVFCVLIWPTICCEFSIHGYQVNL